MQTVLCAVLGPYKDRINIYRVTNILFKEHTHLSSGNMFIHLDAELGLKIRDIISTGVDVLINKETINKTPIVFEDFLIVEYDDIELEKNKLNKKINSLITYEMTSIFALDYCQFISINTFFISKGFYITDETREEVYLKIIETEDDSLLQMMEKYLVLKDKIDGLTSKVNLFESSLKTLECITDNESLERLKNDLNIKE